MLALVWALVTVKSASPRLLCCWDLQRGNLSHRIHLRRREPPPGKEACQRRAPGHAYRCAYCTRSPAPRVLVAAVHPTRAAVRSDHAAHQCCGAPRFCGRHSPCGWSQAADRVGHGKAVGARQAVQLRPRALSKTLAFLQCAAWHGALLQVAHGFSTADHLRASNCKRTVADEASRSLASSKVLAKSPVRMNRIPMGEVPSFCNEYLPSRAGIMGFCR